MENATLLGEFRSVVERSARIPMTAKVIIPESILYGFLDQLEAYLPRSFQDAAQVLREKDQILADAAKEADGLVEAARDTISQGEVLIDSAMQEAKRLLSTAYVHPSEAVPIGPNRLAKCL